MKQVPTVYQAAIHLLNALLEQLILRHHLPQSNDESKLMNCFKVLDSVSIPQGAVVDAEETHYTQYQLVMDSKDCAYYIKPYFTNQIFKIHLDEHLLTKEDMTFYRF